MSGLRTGWMLLFVLTYTPAQTPQDRKPGVPGGTPGIRVSIAPSRGRLGSSQARALTSSLKEALGARYDVVNDPALDLLLEQFNPGSIRSLSANSRRELAKRTDAVAFIEISEDRGELVLSARLEGLDLSVLWNRSVKLRPTELDSSHLPDVIARLMETQQAMNGYTFTLKSCYARPLVCLIQVENSSHDRSLIVGNVSPLEGSFIRDRRSTNHPQAKVRSPESMDDFQIQIWLKSSRPVPVEFSFQAEKGIDSPVTVHLAVEDLETSKIFMVEFRDVLIKPVSAITR